MLVMLTRLVRCIGTLVKSIGMFGEVGELTVCPGFLRSHDCCERHTLSSVGQKTRCV